MRAVAVAVCGVPVICAARKVPPGQRDSTGLDHINKSLEDHAEGPLGAVPSAVRALLLLFRAQLYPFRRATDNLRYLFLYSLH